MRYIIYGKNLEVSEGLKQAVNTKFGKLDKFFTADTEVQITLSVQKENQTVEATIPLKGTILRAEQTSTDMYVSIDMVVDVLERMVRKYKTKISSQEKESACLQKSSLRKMWTTMRRYPSPEANVLRLNLWTPRKPAFRWNYWDIVSMYSVMQRPLR